MGRCAPAIAALALAPRPAASDNDRAFTRHLRERLVELRQSKCRAVDPALVPRRTLWQTVSDPLLFHCVRRFPYWAGLLPAHTPKTLAVQPPPDAGEASQ